MLFLKTGEGKDPVKKGVEKIMIV